jgi:hypothetical protein
MSLFHGFGRFVKDMMSGGGDLNKHIVPGEIRKMAPKELQPGGFDPAKKWLGYDIKADPAHDAKIADRRETADALAAYNQGAPQFRGGQMGMSGPQQIQMPGQQGQIPQQGRITRPRISCGRSIRATSTATCRTAAYAGSRSAVWDAIATTVLRCAERR